MLNLKVFTKYGQLNAVAYRISKEARITNNESIYNLKDLFYIDEKYALLAGVSIRGEYVRVRVDDIGNIFDDGEIILR